MLLDGYKSAMDVGYDPGCIQQIYDQLQRRNAFSTGFAEVAEDYQKLLRQCKELKVLVEVISELLSGLKRSRWVLRCRGGNHQGRNTQLEKEARELRVENAGLQEETERSRLEAVSSERVRRCRPDWVPCPCPACRTPKCSYALVHSHHIITSPDILLCAAISSPIAMSSEWLKTELEIACSPWWRRGGRGSCRRS